MKTKPDYEKQFISTSKFCCPFCKKRTWVDFEIGDISGYQAQPLEAISFFPDMFSSFYDDLVQVMPKDNLFFQSTIVVECVNCGATTEWGEHDFQMVMEKKTGKGFQIEVFQGNGTFRWYWRLRAANGKIVADGSEGYASYRNAVRAVKRVQGELGQTKIIRI